MRVRIRGDASKQDKKSFRLAVKFFGEYMLTPRLFANSYVEIRIKQKLDVSGYCDIIEEGKRTPRAFVLEVKAASVAEMIATIAHEMVHVKQYRRGELHHTRHSSLVRWGKETVDLREVDYISLPWEKEAYDKEEELLCEFAKSLIRQ